MRKHAPFEPIDPNICMWGGVADIINCAKFVENPSKGFVPHCDIQPAGYLAGLSKFQFFHILPNELI